MITCCSKVIAHAILVLTSSINAPSCEAQLRMSSPRPGQAQLQDNGKIAITPQEARRVEEAADRFIKRFRETLDFGVVFDEMFVVDAIQRLRKTGFFEAMDVSQQFIESLDNVMLKRTYKAFMNYYYLKATYDLGVGNETSAPPEVVAVIRTSKFYDLLSDEGSGTDIVTTKKDLEQFVADLNHVATLYKKRLSQDVFNSPTYKASLKAINKDKRSSVRVRNEYEDFGVRKGVRVYEIEQDIFIFFFIEENGKLRALTLGIGD